MGVIMDKGIDKAKELFQNYVNAATDLAEAVKRNIQTDGFVDDKTVNALNNFRIATNELAELQDDMVGSNDENETNNKLS